MPQYTLKAQSVVLLRQMLQLPGWAKTIDQIYRGGKLLVAAIPEVPNGTPMHDPIVCNLEGPERDLCKVAFEHALAKEAVPAGEFTTNILEELKFVST